MLTADATDANVVNHFVENHHRSDIRRRDYRSAVSTHASFADPPRRFNSHREHPGSGLLTRSQPTVAALNVSPRPNVFAPRFNALRCQTRPTSRWT